ncbi:VOC family protein [Edaphobacter aggregans]|uniref:VOC family protein n=1 Tax=Edaphobacter aggregans TaxID=570835 RepID=UPI000550F256|nr:VOC family protein [Edaphobacter aggregans]
MLAQADLLAFIPTVDAEIARRFYVDTLGLTFVSDDEFAITIRTGKTDILISRMDAFNPSPFTILGWKVPDIEATASQFAAAGITFERYPFLEQDANGIWSAPDGAAKVAWFKDPDGNILSISQHA